MCGIAARVIQNSAYGIGAQRPVELLGADVEDRIVALLTRRIVHENIEPAQACDRLFDELAARRFGADVDGQRHCLAARTANVLHHLARIGLLVRQIGDRDVRALARERDRGGAADPGVAAGNQRLAAVEPAAAAVAALTVIGPRRHAPGEARPRLVLLRKRRVRIQRARVVRRGVADIGRAGILRDGRNRDARDQAGRRALHPLAARFGYFV
jgi:hypothetical protein